VDPGHLSEGARWECLQAEVAELREMVVALGRELRTLRRGLAGAVSVMSVFVQPVAEGEEEAVHDAYADLEDRRPRGALRALPSVEPDSV